MAGRFHFAFLIDTLPNIAIAFLQRCRMKPTPSDSGLPADSPAPKPGWTLHILSPEESEKLLREEPRESALQVLAELERKYLGAPSDG